MLRRAHTPFRCAPLGKPVRKTTEAPPLEIPEDWPTTTPVEPVRTPEKVPA